VDRADGSQSGAPGVSWTSGGSGSGHFVG